LAALVLAAFYWRRHGWECLACVAITVAGLIKLYPLVLLPWFVGGGAGGGRGLAQRIGVCAAVAVAGWLVTGPAWWRDFVVVSTPVIRQCMITDPTVFSVPSLVAKYCGDAAAQATGLVVIGLAYAWCARRHGSDEREFSLLCVAMLVAGWVTWAHYLVFLIFPFTLLVIWVLAEPSAGRLTWAAVLWVLLNDNEQGLERLAELLFNCRWPVFALPLAGLAGVGAFFALRIRGTSSDGDRGVTTAAETRKPVGDGA
jgi:hypothetical protein